MPAIDAATVVLVRDGHRGLEVLLLERHIDSDFAGGALVFPGGKVDAADHAVEPGRWDAQDLAVRAAAMGVASSEEAVAMLVAGVRETFEEAGVLVARRPDGSQLTAEDLALPVFRSARARLAERGSVWDWRPWLAESNLTLQLDALALWSWWVTPQGRHRRFDTRFFIAIAPPDQVAEHDAVEATRSVWMRPSDALAAQGRDEVSIIFPTRRNLAVLATYPDADTAWRAAVAGQVDARRIEPTIVQVEGRTMVQHPYEDEPSII